MSDPISPDPAAPAPAPAAPVTAVLLPLAFALKRGFSSEHARLTWYKTEFGPALKSARVHARFVGGGFEVLLSGDGSSAAGSAGHRYHPSDHPQAGQERYTWTDRGDGILYGTLTEAAP